MSELRESFGCINIGVFSRVVLVLDASQSARLVQAEICRLAEELVDQLPATTGTEIYFLGNGTRYSSKHLSQRGTGWFDENRSRASLVTPIFEQLGDFGTLKVMVIGSGVLFDLEDWEDSPLASCTTLVSVGESLASTDSSFEHLTCPDVAACLERLNNPVTCVEIGGEGFMPLEWENEEYKLESRNDSYRLVARQQTRYDVSLRFLATSDAMVEATVTYASGNSAAIPVVPVAESLTSKKRPEGPLSQVDTEVLGCAVRRQSFTCPHCGGRHPWNTLFCRHARGFSEIVYPSLQEVRGFVRLLFAGDSATFRSLREDVLRLQADLVAVRDSQHCTLVRFDPRSATWRCTTDTFAPYHQLEDGSYAILL